VNRSTPIANHLRGAADEFTTSVSGSRGHPAQRSNDQKPLFVARYVIGIRSDISGGQLEQRSRRCKRKGIQTLHNGTARKPFRQPWRNLQ
jgi:hypothetical protein